MRALGIALLALAGNAVADAPQVAPDTAVMLIVGWNVSNHAIVYSIAVPYTDLYKCEADREDMTPEGDNIVRYAAYCTSPSDMAT